MPEFATLLTESQARTFKENGYWIDRLIIDYADDTAQRTPDKVAIIDARGSCTFAELRDLSIRCALGLLSLDIGKDDVVSLQLPNWREWTILHLAATRIGAITNPIVPIFRDRELGYMLRLAETRLLAVPGRFRKFEYGPMALGLKADLPGLEHILVVDGSAPEGTMSWAEFVAIPWEERIDPSVLDGMRPAPDRVTELIFTSGTTGDPKGVLHSHNTLLAPMLSVAQTLNLSSETVFHMTSTFGHQTGFLAGIRLPLQLGATCVYQDIWDPAVFLELIERHKVTISNGGPTFLQDMLRCPNIDRRDLSSFRIFRCGGAPIPRVLIREAIEKMPQVSIYSAWGQTENAIVTMTRPSDPEDKIANTDGYPQRGMEVRVVDDANSTLPPGEEGRLQCRGPSLFLGYAKQVDLTRDSFVGDWFDTGDLAVMDKDGFIRITGRTRDIIIRGGENIPVAYIENVIYEDTRIADVAIVGMPDERLGERACAFIIPRPGEEITMRDLQAHLEFKGVVKQYWPERLEVVDEIPRSANGKIRKVELRARLLNETRFDRTRPFTQPDYER